MTRRLALFMLALASSGFTVVRDPSALQPITWSGATVTLTVQQNGSDDVSDGSDLTAIRSAMAAWGTPACTNFHFTDGGNSPTGGDGQDGTSRVSFVESSWPGGVDSGAVALTNRHRSGNHWTEADVIINGQFKSWATNGDVHRYDIQTTVTHELGHVLGLQHSVLPTATMYFAGRPGLTQARVLAPDDVSGVCFLYPSATFICDGDNDCPLYDGSLYGGADTRTRCSGGSCTSGTVGYGEACTSGAQCASGLCAADPDGPASDDPGTCTEGCTLGGNDCPTGSRCVDVAGPHCFPDRTDCAAHADCGGGNWRCEAQLDGTFACQLLCLTDANCIAVPGSVCQGGTGANPPGWCRVPGALGDGAACADGSQCGSLLCTGPGAQPTCTGDAPGSPDDDGGPVEPDGGPLGGDTDPGGGDTSPGDDGAPPAGDTDPGGGSYITVPDEPTSDVHAACGCGAGDVGPMGLLGVAWLFFRRKK